jgi:hypothetical protein
MSGLGSGHVVIRVKLMKMLRAPRGFPGSCVLNVKGSEGFGHVVLRVKLLKMSRNIVSD